MEIVKMKTQQANVSNFSATCACGNSGTPLILNDMDKLLFGNEARITFICYSIVITKVIDLEEKRHCLTK